MLVAVVATCLDSLSELPDAEQVGFSIGGSSPPQAP